MNFGGRAQRVSRAHVARGEARPAWRLVADLAAAAGISVGAWTSPDDVLKNLTGAVRELEGVDADTMGLLGLPARTGAAV